MKLRELEFPPWFNYVGVFLTLGCNLNCDYCINDPGQAGNRKSLFPLGPLEMPPENWARALARVPHSRELPITLQGGEPTLYWHGKGLGEILQALPHKFDLLTNLTLPAAQFAERIAGAGEKLRRDAPYPSIRVSYHRAEMERLWKGRGFESLIENCEQMANHGFVVSAKKSESDIGIYVVDHPDQPIDDAMRAMAAGRIPLETKEFLGVHDGKLHGSYLYPFSTDLTVRDIHPETLSCECRGSELLIDPLGFVWGCHFYLYEAWRSQKPKAAYDFLAGQEFDFSRHAGALFADQPLKPVGHILDAAFDVAALQVFHPCTFYCRCIGCDTKIKNDRFQSLQNSETPHTSVEIRDIRMPGNVLRQMSARQRARAEPFLYRDRVA